MTTNLQTATRTVTLYRLRTPEGLDLDLNTVVSESYRGRDGYSAVPVEHGGVDGLLITGSLARDRAEWCPALTALTGIDVDLANRTPSGLLVIRTQRAVYGLTYGMGHNMIDPERLDLGFGLQFALRSLDDRSISLVRRHFMDARGRTDENSTTRGGSLRELGTDWVGSIVSKVTGNAVDLPLTHASHGRGNIRVSCKDTSVTLPIAHTPEHFLHDLKVIEDTCALPAPLPGLETLARVRSLHRKGRTALVRSLDGQLDALLAGPRPDRLALSVPGECAPYTEEARAVRITCGSRVTQVDELDLDDVLQAVRDRSDGRRLAALKQSVRIQLFADKDGLEPLHPPVAGHRWITAEMRSGAAYHFYWQGCWYEVGAEYADALREEVSEVLSRPSKVTLPYWPVGEKTDEAWFNGEAAKRDGYDLFDRKNVHTGFFRGGGLEICDLLGPDGQLIMVKKADEGSAGLSHLFAQARTSIEAVRYDNEVRKKFLARVAELRPDLSAEDVLAVPTVVLAIRLKRGVAITADSLFAFAQVLLLQTAMALQGMGARVEVVPVYADDTESPSSPSA